MRHSSGRFGFRLAPSQRLTTTVVALALLAAGGLAIGIESSSASPSTNLIVNSGFEHGSAGWAALASPQHLDLVAGGRSGSYAASLWTTSVGSVVLKASPSPAPPTTTGSVYHAAVWVASATPDVVAVLRVREFGASNLAGSSSRQLALKTTGWQEITLDYTAVADGDAIEYSVVARRLVPGHSLLVDDTWLSVSGPAVPPTPTPSTQSPTPTSIPTPSLSPSVTATATATVLPTVTPQPTPTASSGPPGVGPGSWPVTSLHYAANGNFGSSGEYLPGAAGFNLADVSSLDAANSLPLGVKALVWVGTCDGATPSFQSLVDGFAGNSSLFGFYLMDEPYTASCPPANLKAESDWIHAHVPGAKSFVIMVNMGSSVSPNFTGTYTPANSGVDLVGLDPYPVRTELSTPDYAVVARYVAAAETAGWPQSALVPVYQAFGGGTQTDDAGGYWQLPTAAEELAMLADWAALTPAPAFDYAYSWGTQSGDSALGGSPQLQSVFRLAFTGTP